MSKTKALLYLCCMIGTIESTKAVAACGDARINGAFRLAVGREPTAIECNPGRFAGGAYGSETELIPLVKASLVCSDPWIAQAHYKLGRPINGHDPTQQHDGPMQLLDLWELEQLPAVGSTGAEPGRRA
jgi:hypothetical protein